MLGLPDGITACLFDLDGVLTKTAKVHAAAWQRMFDDYLRARAERTGDAFRPFDPGADYNEYVDGKPRYDGVRSFLQSRGIELPDGTPDDLPSAETVDGLGNRKNELVLELIARGFEPEDVDRIVRLIDLAEYKRRQNPPGVRITTKAFGRDRRMPITNRYGG